MEKQKINTLEEFDEDSIIKLMKKNFGALTNREEIIILFLFGKLKEIKEK